jgi:chromosome partitioning protein
MKTIVVANQKGGVGKTTVARHLAFYGVEKGLRVLVVDMDVQGNFSTTFKNMEDENGYRAAREAQAIQHAGLAASGLFNSLNSDSPVVCAERLAYIEADAGIVDVERRDLQEVIDAGQKRFAELGKDFDVCVLDTGPAVSNLLVVALSVGDFAVSPCKPDRDAIAGLASFFSNVVRVRDETGINPKLAPLGVLPNLVNKNRAYHRSVLADMREAWGDAVLPVELYERAAIDVAKDKAVWRTERGESSSLAAQEMKGVCAHIYKRMGL